MVAGVIPQTPLLPVPGVLIGVGAAGIKHADRNDLTLFQLAAGTEVAAVFTRNAFCAAPVQLARKHLAGGEARAVLPFSTGVIGQRLPVDKIRRALPQAVASLSPAGWGDAARAIMTTDTTPKATSRTCAIAGRTVTVTGIAKGAGMIRPDLATLLSFIATDAPVAREF